MSHAVQSPGKLLIVDDEPFNLRVLRLKFENAGYEVILAENGKEGLEKFQSESPDIVLSDIKMPVMSGLEMGRLLPKTGEYLFLIMTSSLEVETRGLAYGFPGAEFVQKPVSPKALLKRTNQYLKKRHNQISRTLLVKEEALKAPPRQDNVATELSARYEELNLIYRIGENFSLDKNIFYALTELIRDSSETLKADLSIMVLKSRFTNLEKTFSPCNESCLTESEIVLLKKVLDQKLQTEKTPFTIHNTKNIPSLDQLPAMQILAAPVILKRTQGNGYMAFIRSGVKNKFSTGDMRLLSVLSNHASTISTNHNLYQDLKTILSGVVQSLSDAIEAKDTTTRGHTQRVSNLSISIGLGMKLENRTLESLRWAGLLHDIGKIGIPGHILTKPGKLTDEEMEIMKEHPTIGYEILKHVEPLREALPGIRYHHERVDGKGYPEGLKGEEIPLCGRIIAVADTYDSMAYNRPYRKAKSHELTMEEITRAAGSQLDREIVGIFKQVIEKGPVIK